MGRVLSCENLDSGADPVLTVGRQHRRVALTREPLVGPGVV